MNFGILGATEVRDEARRVELPTGRARSLLALLILHVGEPVAAERIIDELWGEDPPRTAGTVVHGLISRLRRSLEPGRAKAGPSAILKTAGTGYCLAIAPESIDANRFKGLLDRARAATPEERSEILADALAMWRGPALADFTYEPFAQRAIAALEELRVQAIEERVEAELSLRRGGDLVAELEEVIAANPFRERLRGFLMLALYRAGRRADALEAYRKTRSLFAEELGLEPGPGLRQLEAAIFREDPGLELKPTIRPGEQSLTASSSWLPRERRTVAVVAVDATPAAESARDPEALGRLGAHAARVASDALERHGARVERLLGDMLMAFFGFPLAHEDDALRAVRAALDARTAVYALDDDPSSGKGVRNRMRAGVEVGEIVVAGPAGALQDIVRGPVLAIAGRLLQAAEDGDVIVGPAAARLLRGSLIMKQVERLASEGTKAFRVLDVVAGASGVPRALSAPMFGREAELTRMRSAFRRSLSSGSPVRLLVLGDAGIGKSRLARELAASTREEANVITLRCPADGEGAFIPVRQAMVEAAGLHGWRALHDVLAGEDHGQAPLNQIAEAMNLQAEPVSASALFPAMRRLFEVVASERPLIIVFEDLHWAEPTFLDLIDLLEREAAGRILLLCIARPDLLENRPEWERLDTLPLGALSSGDLESLVVERAGSIAADTRRQIVEASQGNPLFAEQLLAALDDDAEMVPGSLRGLLTMRLDRLGPGESDVLRCASVVGMDLGHDAVCALLPDDARPFVERHLDALQRKRLIERAGANRLRFCHSLIRQAAYQSMTHEDRAALHERFAEWLKHDQSDQLPEIAQSLGYHVDQAQIHRRAAGTPDQTALQRP
jgi:DNA-binding SARP family transcriptional activator